MGLWCGISSDMQTVGKRCQFRVCDVKHCGHAWWGTQQSSVNDSCVHRIAGNDANLLRSAELVKDMTVEVESHRGSCQRRPSAKRTHGFVEWICVVQLDQHAAQLLAIWRKQRDASKS